MHFVNDCKMFSNLPYAMFLPSYLNFCIFTPTFEWPFEKRLEDVKFFRLIILLTSNISPAFSPTKSQYVIINVKSCFFFFTRASDDNIHLSHFLLSFLKYLLHVHTFMDLDLKIDEPGVDGF